MLSSGVLVLLALVAAASASPIFGGAFGKAMAETQFRAFIARYGKSYASPAERQRRFEIFQANLKYINEFNRAGSATYTLGVNFFADMTNEEFRETFNGMNVDASKLPASNAEPLPANPEVTCPAGATGYTCDWRVAGVVTPIKNQGQCGSCWAFSAVASTEGAHALSTKSLVSLSEQNLVDCSTKQGNQGCNGGLMDQAFEYVIANKGIDTEASYPYTGVQGRCAFKAANIGATLSSYKNVQANSESALQTAVQTVGPISVAIDASHASFQFYQSGVYYEPQCSSTQLDHGVTAIGYGQLNATATTQFWLVKNSWGTDWGMQGFILMSRNRNNNCGIATMASYPIV